MSVNRDRAEGGACSEWRCLLKEADSERSTHGFAGFRVSPVAPRLAMLLLRQEILDAHSDGFEAYRRLVNSQALRLSIVITVAPSSTRRTMPRFASCFDPPTRTPSSSASKTKASRSRTTKSVSSRRLSPLSVGRKTSASAYSSPDRAESRRVDSRGPLLDGKGARLVVQLPRERSTANTTSTEESRDAFPDEAPPKRALTDSAD